MALAVDSALPIINEFLHSLKRIEEILAYVGIFYVGKLALPTVWEILKGLRTHVWSKFFDKCLVETYGEWAVVTGSTDGIGKAYAFELAKNGMNIVLVSFNQEKLDKVADEIRKECGVKTEIAQADFSTGRSIYNNIFGTIDEKDIGILVNNVGMMQPHPMLFEDISEEDMWGMINVNVASVPAMTKLVLPGMLKRKRGAIINISSLGAYMPLPLLQTYSGTKAFSDFFSRALEYEYRSSGIVVQTVLPGVVLTKTGTLPSECELGFLTPSASTYAYHALSTLGYSRRTTGYWCHGIMMWSMKWFPEWLMTWNSYAALKHCAYPKKNK